MNYKEALELVGKPVTLWSWAGEYIGILESVEKRRPWRGNVRILAVTKLDPATSYVREGTVRNQGGANIAPYTGEIPTFQDSLNVLKDKLSKEMESPIYPTSTSYHNNGGYYNLNVRMFKLHFPGESVPKPQVVSP